MCFGIIWCVHLTCFSGFRNAGLELSDEDIYFLQEEYGLNRPIPAYINDENFNGLTNDFLDEPVTLINAKEVYTYALFNLWK